MVAIKKKNSLWLILLLFVVCTNIAIYSTPLFEFFAVEQNPEVVIATLLDLIVVAPILTLLYLKRFSWKMVVGLLAAGCIASRLVIPSSLLSPYKLVTSVGIGLEVVVLAVELLVIGLFLTYMPTIIRQVKASDEPLIFAFPSVVRNRTKNPIVQMIVSEMLVFYYAFASWRQKAPKGITLYKNTSYMAFQIMLIHAIILESVGLHWWLHSMSPIVSTIVLVINVYCVIYMVGGIRAMYLNPIKLNANGFYLSFGLMKRTYVDYRDIEEIVDHNKLPKNVQSHNFIVQDFETLPADIVLKMKRPQTIHLMYGFKKQADYISIKCDDVALLKGNIEAFLQKDENK